MKKKNKSESEKISSSFRDPSGFIFLSQNILYRQINFSYKNHYEHLINSGLLKLLTEKELLISHKEINLNQKFPLEAYKIIQPETIPFISYPYEWCFSQLKDAALTTLQIQKYALEFGMTLKDASAYNIQFKNGKPILIDTLSFEIYEEGKPWIAYRQFCQHFLASLALMAYRDVRLEKLLQTNIDGIPLDLASSLLPIRSFLSPSLFAHIHLQSKIQHNLENKTNQSKTYFLNKKGLLALIDNLTSLVSSLQWTLKNTEWANYYKETNYSLEAFDDKKKIIKNFLNNINPQQAWDIGGNTGIFSRIASTKGIKTICLDSDPVAVEKNYLEMKASQEKNIFPIILDIINPSPAIGWANKERNSLQERGPADTIFALALIHHLVITYNIPLLNIAKFFSEIGTSLIIEFIPKEDSQIQRMLKTSIKTFDNYNQKYFEEIFKKYFSIQIIKPIKDSKRILYYMEKI